MLPQELIDRIIECDKDDVTALRKYSLVCRSWTASSQRHLFSSICLEPGKVLNTSPPLHNSETFLVSGPFIRFTSVAKRSPHILHYTRRIGLSTPSHWHQVGKDVFVAWVMALIPTLPKICHVTLELSDSVSEWAVLLDRMFACFREREAMHHPSSISMIIADPFLANLGFLRDIGVRQFSLVGGETSADDVYTPLEGGPVLLDHLRTLSVSLDPGGMQQFGAWLTHQSGYMPHLEELEFSFSEGEEIVAAYKIIAGGLPPSVNILSLYGERNAFYTGSELQTAVIPAISVAHLKLRLDTKSMASCVEGCVTWWISLSFQQSGPVHSLQKSLLLSTIADLDNLIASLPSLTMIYVVDDADHIITMGNASMVKDVGVLFPKTFSKGLFAF
ncbi:hypothetical protein BDZ89DRAFT_1067319 [Hymenopellis radicata]|nr:hypothetical protein BDZ89DRAFT_1067319 [Hymenopellis radicata]